MKSCLVGGCGEWPVAHRSLLPRYSLPERRGPHKPGQRDWSLRGRGAYPEAGSHVCLIRATPARRWWSRSRTRAAQPSR